MTSSYSTDLKLELMVTGENAGTWGDNTNNNLNLIQQAIAGFEQVTLSSGGTLALAMTDKTLSNARNMVIKFATATIAASTICTIPDSIEKFYIFDATGLTNPTNLTIKTASGTGFTLDAAKIYAAYSDGTNLKEVSLDTLGGTIGTAQIADDAVTNAKIADDAIRAAQISDNAVVTAGILNANVTTDKIADDAVTADKLANTTVSAGSYTAASITVDAQGRLTAASSGAGAANMVAKVFKIGPASGTISVGPSGSKFQAFAVAGGGGGGSGGGQKPGGAGADGGFGFFTGSVSADTDYPFTVGAGGAAAPAPQGTRSNTPGSAGGATNVENLLTTNGGNGGTGGRPGQNQSPGNPGNPGNPSSSNVMSRQILFIGPSNSDGAGDAGNAGGAPQQGGQSGIFGGLAFYTNEG